jgi:hypothetical protein
MPGRKILLIILAVLFLILPFFASLLNLYIDWHYFAETGRKNQANDRLHHYPESKGQSDA